MQGNASKACHNDGIMKFWGDPVEQKCMTVLC